MTITLLKQVTIMLILAGFGLGLFKAKKITLEGSKCLGNILICISLPCVIVNGFLIERTTERVIGLIISAIAALVLLAVAILISRLFMKKDAIAVFASSFSNPGFFGVPIILSCLSGGAVFYIASFIAFLNLLQWTYGVAIMKGESGKLTFKKVVTAPFMIAIFIGMFFFFTGIQMPELLLKSLGHLANMNTPLAMFTIGVYIAQTNILDMLKRKKLYLISLFRLIVIPLVALLLLSLVPSTYVEMKLALLIAIACPVGSNVAVYAHLHDCDYSYAVQTVVVSTLFAVVTMPLIIQLATMIWGVI
ncbi:MAG: AEC family transporter [Saccharofermentans sp.]|nr:AEC family transporter [Saccharofermentans sp.]